VGWIADTYIASCTALFMSIARRMECTAQYIAQCIALSITNNTPSVGAHRKRASTGSDPWQG